MGHAAHGAGRRVELRPARRAERRHGRRRRRRGAARQLGRAARHPQLRPALELRGDRHAAAQRRQRQPRLRLRPLLQADGEARLRRLRRRQRQLASPRARATGRGAAPRSLPARSWNARLGRRPHRRGLRPRGRASCCARASIATWRASPTSRARADPHLLNLHFEVDSRVFRDLEGVVESECHRFDFFGLRTSKASEAYLYLADYFERLAAPFAIAPGVTIAPGEYRFDDVGLRYLTHSSRPVSVEGTRRVRRLLRRPAPEQQLHAAPAPEPLPALGDRLAARGRPAARRRLHRQHPAPALRARAHAAPADERLPAVQRPRGRRLAERPLQLDLPPRLRRLPRLQPALEDRRQLQRPRRLADPGQADVPVPALTARGHPRRHRQLPVDAGVPRAAPPPRRAATWPERPRGFALLASTEICTLTSSPTSTFPWSSVLFQTMP